MAKKKLKTTTIGILFIAFLGLCGCGSIFSRKDDIDISQNKSSDKEVLSESSEQEQETYTVTEIVDGDTIKIDYNGTEEKVRLIGIDSPETNHPTEPVGCFGKEATAKITELLSGEEVYVEFGESQGERDQYGRLLLYVWRDSDDEFINKAMVKGGYAFEYTYNLPYKYQSDFQEAEEHAKKNRLGLWGDVCACEKDKEKSRECVSCEKASVTYTNWDCSTYSDKVFDKNCTSACPKSEPAPTPTPTPTYTCDCSKTCPNISTCVEAQYLLNVCGCSARDGDKDGIACDAMCQ